MFPYYNIVKGMHQCQEDFWSAQEGLYSGWAVWLMNDKGHLENMSWSYVGEYGCVGCSAWMHVCLKDVCTNIVKVLVFLPKGNLTLCTTCQIIKPGWTMPALFWKWITNELWKSVPQISLLGHPWQMWLFHNVSQAIDQLKCVMQWQDTRDNLQ